MYRRLPSRYRRFIQNQPLEAEPQPPNEETGKKIVELKNIPLPNEAETSGNKSTARFSNPFSNILSRIRIDDLILLGLVLLFIDEGRNEAEDDFLIVILLYLFLAGRN